MAAKGMDAEQINRLLDLLEQIAEKSTTYTLTGAADWPLLVFLCGILFALIGTMWWSILAAVKTNKEDTTRDIDNIWKGMRDCKNDCCPHLRTRGKG